MLAAESLKTLWVSEHLTPLLGQRDDLTCKRLLPDHADVKHLLGFLPSGNPTQGRQTKGDASRIRDLAAQVGVTERAVQRIVVELERAGYSRRAAGRLASRHDVDLHRAVELVRRGCPPELATKILL